MTPTPNFDPIVYVVDDDPAVLDSVSLLIRSAKLVYDALIDPKK